MMAKTVKTEPTYMTYEMETAESVASHMHEPVPGFTFKGHTRDWYSHWGNKCPSCPHLPAFETVKVEKAGPRGLRVYLTSGENVNK